MVAIAVVLVELVIIAYIRHRYMDSPIFSATMQVVSGALLVFVSGILLRSARGSTDGL